MPRQRLRVFVVLDGPIVPAWVQRILLDLACSEFAEFAGAHFVAGAAPRSARRGLVFRAYLRIDQRIFGPPGDPLSPADASAVLARVGTAASPTDVDADVVLKLTSAPLPADWLATAPFGVWSFDHLESEGRGGVPFFWAVDRQVPLTETRLRAETPAGSRILVRSSAPTDPTSPTRGRHTPLWDAAGFVARALRNAAEGRAGSASTEEASRTPLPEHEPGPLELARFLTSTGIRVARSRLRRRTHEECWMVALRHSRGSLVDGPMDAFVPVPMPADRWYADPFLVPDGRRLWLFFEDADRATGKGVIRCSEVRPDGTVGESHVALERDYHLSYPLVFQRGGEWYMLPETSAHRTVELFRAVEFPWRWKLEKVLLAGMKVVDATLLDHAGRLWLFAGVGEAGGSANEELFVFHADALEGVWHPHPQNPVVSDRAHARPAGPFFTEAGVLYRPGQDCSITYGSAFWIHRVDQLDEHGYRETPVRRVEASWYPGLNATHTIHRAGGFDAIDGRLWLRRGRDFQPPQRTS